ncbi:MATE family efflux transporter [Caldibacillus debilis]|uniref:Putative efflux protein, MATE family n=1 Tax=Caldibacillus debilis GB1 TaxID=1339248 RepID=A0A420VD91_9BACI|nr:MATE family efflux transporter [Caldibacillus debilis]RKO61293.1 putative efflux protein, MATE family [Caldibacillus debilis GB1]
MSLVSHESNEYRKQTLFSLTWPLFVELSLHMGIGIIATLMISHYSDYAAAGIGVANQLLTIFILLFNITSIGATILIGQHLGAERYDAARRLARSAAGMNFWIGMVLSVFVLFWGKYLLNFYAIEGSVLRHAVTFMQITGASLFLESVSLAFGAVLRSHGYTKESMIVSLFMNGITVAGNFLAIYGPFGLPVTGVAGVSWAIVAARLFVAGALIYLLNKKIALRLHIRDLLSISKRDMKDLLAIGVPSAGENLSYQFSQIVITSFVSVIGAEALAARVYILNISMVCYLFTVAVSQGSQILISRSIGARDFEGAFQRGIRTLKMSFCISAAISLIIAFTGSPLLRIFTDNPEIISIGVPVLWSIVFIEPGRALNIVLMGALKSTGDVNFPVIIGMISMWGIAVVFSYLLGISFGLGLLGVWIAQGLDEWFRGAFAYRRWLSQPWLKVKVKVPVNH